jgi:predicted RNA-binding protein with PIN domain
VTRILVDGMNVIGAQGASAGPWWRDRPAAQAALAARLSAYADAVASPAGDAVCVVFDGAPVAVAAPGVDGRFATRRGRDAADDDIAALAGPDTRVVTSDAALAATVRAAGAQVTGAGAFLRELDVAGV